MCPTAIKVPRKFAARLGFCATNVKLSPRREPQVPALPTAAKTTLALRARIDTDYGWPYRVREPEGGHPTIVSSAPIGRCRRYGLAAALISAENLSADRAVIIVHEFITSASKYRRFAIDLHGFLSEASIATCISPICGKVVRSVFLPLPCERETSVQDGARPIRARASANPRHTKPPETHDLST